MHSKNINRILLEFFYNHAHHVYPSFKYPINLCGSSNRVLLFIKLNIAIQNIILSYLKTLEIVLTALKLQTSLKYHIPLVQKNKCP